MVLSTDNIFQEKMFLSKCQLLLTIYVMFAYGYLVGKVSVLKCLGVSMEEYRQKEYKNVSPTVLAVDDVFLFIVTVYWCWHVLPYIMRNIFT